MGCYKKELDAYKKLVSLMEDDEGYLDEDEYESKYKIHIIELK